MTLVAWEYPVGCDAIPLDSDGSLADGGIRRANAWLLNIEFSSWSNAEVLDLV